MTKKQAKPWLPILMIGLALIFIVYDYVIQVAPSIMTETIMMDFHIGAKGIGILGSGFLLAYAIMQLPAGILLDRYGARSMLSIAAVISGLGALFFAFSHTLLMGSIARILVGTGSAFSFLGGVYIAYRWLKPTNFALAVGILQLGAGIGAVIGEAPLARLLHSISWRNSFIIISGFAFILAITFIVFIKNQPIRSINQNHKMINKNMKNSLFSAFSVFSNQHIWVLVVINFITWLPASAVGGLWGIPYLKQALHLSSVQSGAVFIALWASISFMAPIIGFISDKLNSRKIVIITTLILSLFGSIGLLWISHMPLLIVMIALFLLGLAPASQCVVFSLLRLHIAQKYYSTSAAMCNMASVIGGAFGQVTMGYLIAYHAKVTASSTHPIYTMQNYKTGMLLIPIVLVIGVITAIFFIKDKRHSITL